MLPYGPGLNGHVWASLLFGEWDICLDFTGSDRSALMAWLSRAENSYGYAKWGSDGWRARAYNHLCPASVREQHTVDFHLALVQQAMALGTLEDHLPTPWMKVPAGLPCPFTAPDNSKPVAVVHIGTAREEKFWLDERWAEVIESLATTHQVILTGTNEGLERPHLDRVRALIGSQATDLSGRLSLEELAALISKCSIALGVDSMAMHLAAMFNRPQVVLFGPTNPFHWRPRQPHAVVVAAGHDQPLTEFAPKAKGAEMNLISTAQVVNAIRVALSFS